MTLPDNEMLIEYDEEIQSYFIAWRPMAAMGIGGTAAEALEELRQAAHFGIDTMVDLRLKEIGSEEEAKRGKQG
jgi:predicted RNase H-like HicB family nuclease